MAKDKFSAVWVSYSSISDFLSCPRLYYLRNIYKNPDTNHKISVMSPPLGLGQAVHEVIEGLSVIKTDKRFTDSLLPKFETAWKKVQGQKGGFFDADQENVYRTRGENMIKKVMKHPGPLANLAIKINQELPHYWLSEDDNIILCGKIDWIEYLKDQDSVHIIDFKTGKGEEDPDSLQLPIYYLLASNCQKRSVAKMSYWYIEQKGSPTSADLPDPDKAYKNVLDIAKKISLARKLDRFPCSQDTGCKHCRPYEAVLAGRGTLVGTNDFGQDVFVVEKEGYKEEDSRVL